MKGIPDDGGTIPEGNALPENPWLNCIDIRPWRMVEIFYSLKSDVKAVTFPMNLPVFPECLHAEKFCWPLTNEQEQSERFSLIHLHRFIFSGTVSVYPAGRRTGTVFQVGAGMERDGGFRPGKHLLTQSCIAA